MAQGLRGHLPRAGQGLVLTIFGMCRVWATQTCWVNPRLHKCTLAPFSRLLIRFIQRQKCQLSKSDFEATSNPSKKNCKVRLVHNFYILFLLFLKPTDSGQNSSFDESMHFCMKQQRAVLLSCFFTWSWKHTGLTGLGGIFFFFFK